MKIIKDITEGEFVSEFLKGEIDSPRFGHTIHLLLASARERKLEESCEIRLIRKLNG